MNILGFVSAILIIFSIICASMLHQHQDSNQIKNSIEGYYSASTESQDFAEKNFFKSIKGEKEQKIDIFKPKPNPAPLKKTQSPIEEVKKTEPADKIEENESDNDDEDENEAQNIDRGKNKVIYSCSVLNILPLLKDGKDKEHDCYEIFAKLIRAIYEKELTKKNMEYLLIDTLIKKSQEILTANEELFLEKIYFGNESLQNLWYKMLKGSKFYNLEKNIGYPSIFEFVSLYNSNKTTICMQKISDEMLMCLFNKKIAGEIKEAIKRNNEKNKKKTNYISQHDLADILSKNNFDQKNQDLNIISHLAFSNHKKHKKNPSLIISKDTKTQISIKKKI
jgi:hypothetical protein